MTLIEVINLKKYMKILNKKCKKKYFNVDYYFFFKFKINFPKKLKKIKFYNNPLDNYFINLSFVLKIVLIYYSLKIVQNMRVRKSRKKIIFFFSKKHIYGKFI